MQQRCPSKEQLSAYLNELSLAVIDISLFLDTHPDCPEALKYYQDMVKRRQKVMTEYSIRFGPLTLDSGLDGQNNYWEWVNQPWPWEASTRRCN